MADVVVNHASNLMTTTPVSGTCIDNVSLKDNSRFIAGMVCFLNKHDKVYISVEV